MIRTTYLNGTYLPHTEACVPVEDRGLQFSDAVYEVVAFLNGRFLDFDPHYARLERSLGELAMKNPLTRAALRGVCETLVQKNSLSEGIVYIQITRGVASRDHAFPDPAVEPTVIATAKALDMAAIAKRGRDGVGVILTRDIRWARPDIKSTSLLGNVLAKEAARRAGSHEAWFVDDKGFVTEGTSSNAWIVTKGGLLVTRSADGAILSGITRGAVMAGATRFEERPFSAAEAKKASEAFLTSTTSFVMPVVAIDGQEIGNGKPGPVTRRAQEAYWGHIREATGFTPAG